jgi:FkbM family methyltransferase
VVLHRFLPPLPLRLRHPWVSGGRVRLNLRRHVAYWGHGLSAYEPHVARALVEHVRPEWLVVEVGAHVGFFTLLLASRASRVLVFEPDERNRRDLARNLALNAVSNVEVVSAACGSATGEAEFVTDPRSGSAGGLAQSHHGEHAGPIRRVAVTRLDEFLRDRGAAAPDLVKIDAEGAEDDVLVGMGALLDGPTRVLVEVGERTKEAVQRRLRDHGYRILNPNAGMTEQRPGTYAGWHVFALR